MRKGPFAVPAAAGESGGKGQEGMPGLGCCSIAAHPPAPLCPGVMPLSSHLSAVTSWGEKWGKENNEWCCLKSVFLCKFYTAVGLLFFEGAGVALSDQKQGSNPGWITARWHPKRVCVNGWQGHGLPALASVTGFKYDAESILSLSLTKWNSQIYQRNSIGFILGC